LGGPFKYTSKMASLPISGPSVPKEQLISCMIRCPSRVLLPTPSHHKNIIYPSCPSRVPTLSISGPILPKKAARPGSRQCPSRGPVRGPTRSPEYGPAYCSFKNLPRSLLEARSCSGTLTTHRPPDLYIRLPDRPRVGSCPYLRSMFFNDDIMNGLCLCENHHCLSHYLLISFDVQYRTLISGRIEVEHPGSILGSFHKEDMILPENPAKQSECAPLA